VCWVDSVYPAVEQRSDLLVCLLVYVHSDSGFSGVTGLHPQLYSHTYRLPLQQDSKTCRTVNSVLKYMSVALQKRTFEHLNTQINRNLKETRATLSPKANSLE